MVGGRFSAAFFSGQGGQEDAVGLGTYHCNLQKQFDIKLNRLVVITILADLPTACPHLVTYRIFTYITTNHKCTTWATPAKRVD